MTNATAVDQHGPLALICGGGTLPLAVADSAAKRGRNLLLFPIWGHAEPAMVERYPHCSRLSRWGQSPADRRECNV